MNERLEAKEGNIICPGYDNHKPRVLEAGEMFAHTDTGEVVCSECEWRWSESPSIERRAFYPQED